jgi:hypothetical protein
VEASLSDLLAVSASQPAMLTQTAPATPHHIERLRVMTKPNVPAQAGRGNVVRLPTRTRSRTCLQPDGWAFGSWAKQKWSHSPQII